MVYKYFLYCCSFVVLFSVHLRAQLVEDPCKPESHRVLSESHRSRGFDVRPSDVPYCDSQLQRGWYRFIDFNLTALEVPTECPGVNTCGTVTPIWMNGSHPGMNDGIVVRQSCGQLTANGSCCEVSDLLFVKNCESFYVYYLIPTANCPSGYCAGDRQRCPVDKWSTTNFEPCRDLAPVLTNQPVVTGPIVYPNQSFHFRCEWVFGPNDSDQMFQVLWTFNNKSDPAIPPEIFTGAQRVATLTGDRLKDHLDSDVGCVVNTYYLREKDRHTYLSKTSLFGVQAVNLTGPHLREDKQSFDFDCEVTYGSGDPNQKIEVIWTFNDRQDSQVKPQIITGSQRKATLKGSYLMGHINSEVGCQARLVYDGYSIKTDFRKSAKFFAGYKISRQSLEIYARQESQYFRVTSTLPVVCNQSKDCCLSFRIRVDRRSVITLKNSCDYKICTEDWDPDKKEASFNVTVATIRNSVGSASRIATLLFDDVVLSSASPYQDLYKKYKIDSVKVVVHREAGSVCSITGDPHFRGFDFRRVYDLYQTGDYIVYAVKERDFQVQIRSWPCWAVTCVCGVVVREKNDIIKIHGCDKPGRLTSASVEIPRPLSPGTLVRRSSSGQHVGILLSSGSELKVDIYDTYMDLYIQTPAFDWSKARGMCGTNDGNPGNDFTHSDGRVSPPCEGQGRCLPVEFSNSWRVTGWDSLFTATPAPVPDQPSQYCSCTSSSLRRSDHSCSYRQHIHETGLTCASCKDITPSLQPSPWGQPGQTQKEFHHQTVQDVDPKKKWPNDAAVTEAQAKDLCTKALQKSQLYTRCKNIQNLISAAMTECLGDILNGGTTDALNAVASSFTNNCQRILAKDEKNYRSDSEGNMVLRPELNDFVCPVECLDHGKCGRGGKCVCQAGWEGEACQIEKGKGPQINYTQGTPLCIAELKHCESVEFDKSNVNIYSQLKCRVQTLDSQGNKMGQLVVLEAANSSVTQVRCPLPTSENSTQSFLVSVTSDGVTYGNELPVIVFDSTCLNCTNANCSVKSTACHINNVCYSQGMINPNNETQMCDIQRDSTNWSDRVTVTSTANRLIVVNNSLTSTSLPSSNMGSLAPGDSSVSPEYLENITSTISNQTLSNSYLTTTPALPRSDNSNITSAPTEPRSLDSDTTAMVKDSSNGNMITTTLRTDWDNSAANWSNAVTSEMNVTQTTASANLSILQMLEQSSEMNVTQTTASANHSILQMLEQFLQQLKQMIQRIKET